MSWILDVVQEFVNYENKLQRLQSENQQLRDALQRVTKQEKTDGSNS